MSFPEKCLVDTNVPINANLAKDPAAIPDDLVACVQVCVDAIHQVIKKRRLVIDSGDEIFDEYRHKLSMKGQPGIGDAFMKWVNDHRYNPVFCDRVEITKTGNSYSEFPTHRGLENFDQSDRKFIAVANAHPDKPPIIQSTDSKWWGWKSALAESGIAVHFLCGDYVEVKFDKKIGV